MALSLNVKFMPKYVKSVPNSPDKAGQSDTEELQNATLM